VRSWLFKHSIIYGQIRENRVDSEERKSDTHVDIRNIARQVYNTQIWKQRSRRDGRLIAWDILLRTSNCVRHDILHKDEFGVWGSGGAKGFQDQFRLLSGPVVQNVTQEEHCRILDGLWRKEIVSLQLNSTIGQSFWVFSLPILQDNMSPMNRVDGIA
jgi:hypothetical protein